ncbi:hypothetical protein AXG93_3667s1040 [Marchantia polymorpha subsp. ruderalis]|uniref:Uncharacterized protein n=1 Tax=Marchantia polymorpha subsp. ruderalis TaxID=1480154 RepID=A0A176VZM6_MARPO|nr:hypothetical protein AXG93_3667s1040 [Marchantia polymorpha subsp. ruderalis]
MKWRSCFHEGLVQYLAEDVRPSVLESLELPTKEFGLWIPIEVKDGDARERNSNGGTFNLHEFALPLQRRTIARGAQEKVLARSAGEDGDLTFDSESVKVTREKAEWVPNERVPQSAAKECSSSFDADPSTMYAALFKIPRRGKNGYKNDMVAQLAAKICSNSFDADPSTFPNNLHNDLAI